MLAHPGRARRAVETHCDLVGPQLLEVREAKKLMVGRIERAQRVLNRLASTFTNGNEPNARMANNGSMVKRITVTATIEGKFQILDGKIELGNGMPSSESGYTVLIVTENAELWGGTFAPFVNPLTSALRDYIQTDKKLDIDSAFTISPHQLGNFQYVITSAWPVLGSEDGFTDLTNPTNGDPDHYTMARSEGEDPKTWVVKPKPPE